MSNDYKKGITKVVKKFLSENINYIIVNGMAHLSQKHYKIRKQCDFIYARGDYVRFSSLELIAREIEYNSVQGSVAEVGVYRGDFAETINYIFPDKKLYLFDTFDGFNKKDVEIDKSNNYSTGSQNFSNTSITTVLKKMSRPENCIIKKGYFPETAKDVDDNFCFVSLDADLYKPIYDGLKFFYPRMSKGGYIFVHDFNNVQYKGAKKAVYQFIKEEKIPFFPLSDVCGSAVIMR